MGVNTIKEEADDGREHRENGGWTTRLKNHSAAALLLAEVGRWSGALVVCGKGNCLVYREIPYTSVAGHGAGYNGFLGRCG